MFRWVLVASLFVVTPIAQTAIPPAGQQLPTFRTGVDIVELDVTVLDKDRHPIKGLTADDFTILEGGKPQSIVAFSSVDVPAAAPYSAAWIRDAPLDVVSNLENARLVTIVMDDAYTGQSPAITKRAKDIARAAIDQLGPRDLASVVFTFMGRMQNYTADRSALIRAVDSFVPKVGNGGLPLSCDPRLRSCDIETLSTVASTLASAPPGRKILILVSGGRRFSFGGIGGSGVPSSATHRNEAPGLVAAFSALQRANVTIYAFDVQGLTTGVSAGRSGINTSPFSLAGGVSDLSNESLHAFANSTGGRAITNTNDPADGVADAFREIGTYYFVGFRSTAAGDRQEFRKIQVKLNRPGVNVRTRNGYYTPGKSSGPVDVINGLPGGDLPLQATAAVFAAPGRSSGEVLLAAALDPAARDLIGKSIDLTATLLDLDGRPCGTQHGSTSVGAPQAAPLHLSAEPGRYLVQLSAQAEGRSGVVVVDVEVPNFSRDALSASGLIMGRAANSHLNDTGLPDLPFLPSTQRQFQSTDDVAAFLRVYEGGSGKTATVRMSAKITDEKNVVRSKNDAVLEATNFSAARSADYSLPLPLAQLSPGRYLLEVDARLGDRRVQRTARFTVR
jgi:VWFA-related protein